MSFVLQVLAHFGGYREMHTAPGRNEPTTSALCRSKENNFLYRMVNMEVKIKRKIFSEYRSHHFSKSQISYRAVIYDPLCI
jgi:hypothetical protein